METSKDRHAEASAYWDGFYKKDLSEIERPSQFAAFVASEFRYIDTIVDVGCGSGRDSLFFATHRHRVCGVDASASAVALASRRAQAMGLANCRFVQADASQPLAPQLAAALPEGSVQRLVYARFFLHAVDERTQTAFLASASDLGQTLAVEFRTNRDSQGARVTPTHYRRYIKPMTLIAEAQTRGFEVVYYTDGFGFAKYQDDDAHVARIVFARQEPATTGL